MKDSKKISAVIIAYNEEKLIGDVISSCNKVADEVIVIDSFSTDNTVNICEKLGAQVYQNKFDGHIQQKNFALTKANYEYVLSVDADEVLSQQLIDSINSLKPNLTKTGYSFNRMTNYCGKWIKHSGWYPDVKLRLWKKGNGEWGGTNPHDKVILHIGATTQHIKGDLLHYSYYSFRQHIQQINYFTDILAKEQAPNPRKKASMLKTLFSPIVKFCHFYIIKSGWRDGFYGFIICSFSAFATFSKYLKIRELRKYDQYNHQ